MTVTRDITEKLESLSSDDYKMVVMLIDRLCFLKTARLFIYYPMF